MSRSAISTALAASLAILATTATAQEEDKIPRPLPLVARFTDASDRLLIGGGPEAEDVAGVLGATTQARVVGGAGAVPLLAQGTIALAVLTRDLTLNERTATRRFSGMRPLSLQIGQGLWIVARRDAAGAADARVRNLLAALLSDAGQVSLATGLDGFAPLPPAALAATRATLTATTFASVPDGPAGYRQDDGRQAIVGSDTLVTLLPDLLADFARHRPGAGFALDLRGSSLAIPALTAGTSAIAPMGREAWQDDLDAFRQVKGYAPTRVRIAYASHGPRPNGKTPPAIYVNAANPLAHLSLAEMRRIFAAGTPGGDISMWSALGVATGRWKDAPIHVYGGREDGGFAEAMRQTRLDGLPFSARYRGMPSGPAILKAVAADPLAIGYATWMDGGEAPAGVRIVPLGKTDAGPFVLPGDAATRGGWPISYFFNVYVDRAPERRLAPDLKALLVYLLSDRGQQMIAAHGGEEDGYVPLSQDDLQAERKIVEQL